MTGHAWVRIPNCQAEHAHGRPGECPATDEVSSFSSSIPVVVPVIPITGAMALAAHAIVGESRRAR